MGHLHHLRGGVLASHNTGKCVARAESAVQARSALPWCVGVGSFRISHVVAAYPPPRAQTGTPDDADGPAAA